MKQKVKTVLLSVWQLIKKEATHHPVLKLLSLLIAIILWAGLISQDSSITREKVFNNVTLSVTGSDMLKRNGYIVVSDISSEVSGYTVSAQVPQLQYDTVSITNYNPRIDLSKITSEGTQTLVVTSTSSIAYGSVTEIHPATVDVEVESYITRYRIPVSIVTTGELPEGYATGSMSLTPPNVTVSGPASLVNSIVRGQAVLDLSTIPVREGTVRTAAPLTLMNASGEAVDSKLLSVTSESVLIDSVVVEQTIYSTKDIPVSTETLVKGQPAAGYEIAEISVSPASITGVGQSEALDAIEALVNDATVDVSGASQSITQSIKIHKPSELLSISADTVSVTVKIVPSHGERTFQNLKINVVGLSEQQTATLNTKGIVTVSGETNELDQLTSADLVLVVDASGLEAGTHTLPVAVAVNSLQHDNEVTVVPETVTLTIKSK